METYNLSKKNVNGAKEGVYDILLEKTNLGYEIILNNAGTRRSFSVPARTIEAWRSIGNEEDLSALLFPLIPQERERANLVSLIRQSKESNLF